MQPRWYDYPSHIDCCIDCYVEIKRSLVVDLIDFGREVEDSFRQDLVLFAAPHYNKMHRLHFLRCVLLQPSCKGLRALSPSLFWKFTYIRNGLDGRISEIEDEDILDRVFSFF